MEGYQLNLSPGSKQDIEASFIEQHQQAEHTLDQNEFIYQVPETVFQENPKLYAPSLFSIGPIYNERNYRGNYSLAHLQKMTDFKEELVVKFFTRTKLSSQQILVELNELWPKIYDSYAATIHCKDDVFKDIILNDIFFILEFVVGFCDNPCDRIFSKVDITQAILDLVKAENQLPYCVLEKVYNLVHPEKNQTFLQVTFKFFKFFNNQCKVPDGEAPLHFTDLLRRLLLPSPLHRGMMERTANIAPGIFGANHLFDVGLIFEPSASKSLFDIAFDQGVLRLPPFEIDAGTEIYMRSILLFEGRHYSDFQYIADYMLILKSLVKGEDDLNILIEEKIIVNMLGTTNEALKMLQRITSIISLKKMRSDYRSLLDALDRIGNNTLNKHIVSLGHEQSSSPGGIVITTAAATLL